jgi:Holliday junction resolvasome RuvABC endonuclease subunit
MTDSLEKILSVILNSQKKPIVFSAIENQFKGKNIKTTINLARSSGMVIEMIYKITNTKPFIFEPSEWMSEMNLKTKQSCPQRDQELKSIIKERYGKEIKSIDECCAIGIATKLANLCKK